MFRLLWTWRQESRRRTRSQLQVESLEDRVLLSSTRGIPKPMMAVVRAPSHSQSDADHDDHHTDHHDETHSGIFDEHGGERINEPPEPIELLESSVETPVEQLSYVLLNQTFSLHSLPEADHTIYLDFDGHVTQGTTWNSSSGISSIVSSAYDPDGNGATFTPNELRRIQRIWERVAEDFAPFAVNVTTEDPGEEALRKNGSGDTQWGIRVVITPDKWDDCGCGGFAYINSFNDSADEPVFVFNTTEIGVSAAASHEVGHALGLSHDGTSSEEYYDGHGSGTTGWGPIMGSGYYSNVTTWDTGHYHDTSNGSANANYGSGPDDFAVITSQNGFGFRPDDHESGIQGATSLTVIDTADEQSELQGFGRIEMADDNDWFSFSTSGGAIDLTIDTYFTEAFIRSQGGSYTQAYMSSSFSQGSNLDVLAKLYDSTGTLILSSNPAHDLSAQLRTTLAAGTYFVSIEGVGYGDWAQNPPQGYAAGVSLGQYLIRGTVAAQSAEFNNSPTLHSIPQIQLYSDSLPVTRTLTGISAGFGETQPIRITAVSQRPELIAHPQIDYQPGSSEALMTLTPVGGQTGTTIVTVTVEDGGLDGNLETVDDNLTMTREFEVLVREANQAPIVSDQSIGMVRNQVNGTVVGTVAATDSNPDQTLTYSIASATDSRAFAINSETGELTVARRKSVRSIRTHEVIVRVTDNGDPSLSSEATITIQIVKTNTIGFVELNPLITSIDENASRPGRIAIAEISVVDDGVGTNELAIDGPHASLFEIEGNRLYLKAGSPFDFETTPLLSGSITVTDPSLSNEAGSSTPFNLAVGNVDELLTGLELDRPVQTIAETLDTAQPYRVADLRVLGDALGSYQFTLDGVDAELFEISNGQLFLKAGVTLNRLTNPRLDVSVVVDEVGMGWSDDAWASLSIMVTEVPINSPPVLFDQSFSVEKKSPTGTLIGIIDAEDAQPNQQLTYELISGNSKKFQLNTETGELTVRSKRSIRSSGVYELVIRVTDSGEPAYSREAVMTVTVE
ncbi:cadherin domain-containing protein [Thalassoglobus sp. JC818]|uniref:cadherin domain-containing protein n=1 Tax=Thalassoglobus sp. JC818 TaxID=3232136 RepID=UPI003458D027